MTSTYDGTTPVVCGCGQDLDENGSAYCPRCGCQRDRVA